MYEILHQMLNISLSAGILIAVICVFRLVFKKAPKWITCLLWGVAGLRLVLPFSWKSPAGLLPPGNIISYGGTLNTGVAALDSAAAAARQTVIAPAVNMAARHYGVSAYALVTVVLFALWLFGVAAMAVAAAVNYRSVYRQVKISVKSGDVYLCDTIAAPFILGFIRPRIYVPSAMQGSTLSAVLAHEQAHIRRRDHWWKPLGYLILCVYWFNPMVWLAYILLCRDIESACDEKVIKAMSSAEIADYTQALLNCSKPQKALSACPLAFGETGVKQRIKSALSYKKPALWIIITALVACAAVAVCFTANRREPPLTGVQVLATNDKGELHCFNITQKGRLSETPVTDPFGSYNGMDAAPDCFTFRTVGPQKAEVTVERIAFTALSGEEIPCTVTPDYRDLFGAVERDIHNQFDKLTLFDCHTGSAGYYLALRRGNQTEIYHYLPAEKALRKLCTFKNYAVKDILAPAAADDGTVVYNAIMETYFKHEGLGECSTAGYVILGSEKTDGERKLYCSISFSRFGFINGFFTNVSGGSNPAVITVDNRTGDWVLDAPRDGSLYAPDIKKLFPEAIRKKLELSEEQNQSLWEQQAAQARAYLDSIGREAEVVHYSSIEHTLLTDCGVPADVSNTILRLNLPFDSEIGSYEKITDGVRYVYQTEYDAQNNLIRFTKYEYDTGHVVQYWNMDAQTGAIQTGLSEPGLIN